MHSSLLSLLAEVTQTQSNVQAGLLGIVAVVIGVALTLWIPAVRRRAKRDRLIELVVLGDPEAGVLPIRDLITERTKQIQPNQNGGKSLADVHKRLDTVVEDITALKTQFGVLSTEARDNNDSAVAAREGRA